MKTSFLAVHSIAAATLILIPLNALAIEHEGHIKHKSHVASTGAEKETVLLGKPGEKQPLDDSHYFIFSFDKPPKMGTRIVKVAIYTKDGKRETSFEVKGEIDMPSMRGAHSSGMQPFKTSKKGDYLLPVSLVMPGDWELRLTFIKEGKTVVSGRYPFTI